MRRVIQGAFFSLLVVLAACSSGPLRSFSTGDELAVFDFADSQSFEEGAYSDATLRIIDGVYRIVVNQGDGEIWWGQWGATLNDVVIEVEVEQVSERIENAYGVACRLRGVVGQEAEVDPELAAIASGETAENADEATEDATSEATLAATSDATETTEDTDAEPTATADEAAEDTDAEPTATAEETTEDAETEPTATAEESGTETEETADSEDENLPNGDGYMFLIRGDGSYAILRSRGRNLTPLVNWTNSALINQGPARNELRAVCMGDYLALYINGEFAGDATDNTYSSGQIGLAASAYNRLGVQIEFDNLTVHQANAG